MDAFRELKLKCCYRKMSDGMFLSACREVAKEYPDVVYDEDLLDRVCLKVTIFPQLVLDILAFNSVHRFRSSLTPNHTLTASW